jgi:2-polyprenyl-6-methoxyphenol hydroxylase-like FAD-dependent oxidoreductase
MKILIIGGGIGGLALAQALKKAGIGVAVFERDASAMARVQGYSIFLTGPGVRALRECLPKDLWNSLFASRYRLWDELHFTTEKLDRVFSWPNKPGPPEDRGCTVDRSELRRVLLSEIDDKIHFNKKFVRYERTPRNKVVAYFEDGSSATGDLLIGADGVYSKVREQLLGVGVKDTGVLAMVANTPLTRELKNIMDSTPLRTAACVMGLDGWSGLVAKLEHKDIRKSHVFWTILAKRSKWHLEEGSVPTDKETLFHIARNKMHAWHPIFRQIVDQADLSTILFWPLVHAVKVTSYNDPVVTLLGDAAHCMPPTLNMGGNTALRDAQLLYQQLDQVNRGALPMSKALDKYVEQMVRVGFSALESSMKVLNFAAMENTLKRRLAVKTLKTIDTILPRVLKRTIAL